jgi:regulator of sigma E protease
MLTTLLAFAVTIVIIVAFHEYGHYLAMRIFGVRVLKFSVGFGPRLAGWTSRGGTEFVISGVPLGGFVRPLDRRESEVPAEEADRELQAKPPWQRIIIYAAGPGANLVLALALYWVVMLGGETMIPPVVGEVQADSVAAEAGLEPGDELLELGEYPVRGWSDVTSALMHFAGESGPVPVRVSGQAGDERTLSLSLAPWSQDVEKSPLKQLGFSPRPPRALVGEVRADSPAERAGLQSGDRVVAAGGEPVENWRDWVESVRAHPGETLTLTLVRDGERRQVDVVPEAVDSGEEAHGRVGVAAGDIRRIDHGVWGAVPAAWSKVTDQTGMILGAMGRMVTGDLSLKTLGGPVTIAQAAGQTASTGISTFMLFLAFFSISLGLINLLPVPMLDGGWIVFGFMEWVSGRPLPERFLMMAQSIGLTAVIMLMSLAIYNDLVRHFG